jgi:hypothetical protein
MVNALNHNFGLSKQERDLAGMWKLEYGSGLFNACFAVNSPFIHRVSDYSPHILRRIKLLFTARCRSIHKIILAP